MRYLIDTNVFVNMVIDDYISNDVMSILDDYENIIYISSECIKEYIHLVQNKKVVPKKSVRSLSIFDLIYEFGLNVKYVEKSHLNTLSKLDVVENHNDPSDRLIIAQAITEKIPLISSDTKFPAYVKYGLDFISSR